MSKILSENNLNQSENTHIAVLGAGIIGLSCALHLQKEGYKVTLIDQDEPGLGTSFGNAGLFAYYSRQPLTSFSALRSIPSMLLDNKSPLSINNGYLPQLMSYGWHFAKACSSTRYRKGTAAMSALQELAPRADKDLFTMSNSTSLIRSHGSLALFSNQSGFKKYQAKELKERKELGVEMAYLSHDEVQEIEPNLSSFHEGGVYYPSSRHTVSPIALSQSLFKTFCQQGGQFIRQKVKALRSDNDGISVQTALEKKHYDQLIIAAGAASKNLVLQLGLTIPLVSERGYHLMLDEQPDTIKRPIGWVDTSVFITPMTEGIRVAGTSEFADPDAAPSSARAETMLSHAEKMLGHKSQLTKTWYGSRPSTPDSLPVIGQCKSDKRITLAFGHGHLGLTLAGITGKLVAQLVDGQKTDLDMTPFSPERFI